MFRAIGEETLWCAQWETGEQVSNFLEHCIDSIEGNNLTNQAYEKLWGIFAPTCTWDDNGGGTELGNELFELLDRQRVDFGGANYWKEARASKSNKSKRTPSTTLHVNRVKAAGRIAPLLSWRHLRELPWMFRICFLLIGVCVLALILAMLASVFIAVLGI